MMKCENLRERRLGQCAFKTGWVHVRASRVKPGESTVTETFVGQVESHPGK